MRSAQDTSKGFTLVELLVVISIIAILSVLGFSLFTGVQKQGRDTTRRAELKAIANAMEIAKGSSTNYVVLGTTHFAKGTIPQLDPQGLVYCGNTDATIPAGGLTAASTANACTPTGVNNYSPISTTIPPAGPSWKICTWLEEGGGKSFCLNNQQ